MAIRITPQLDSTQDLLGQVLSVVLQKGQRVKFLVPAGESSRVAQRLRVMISRNRKTLYAQNKRPKRFVLRADSYPHTEDGVRYDCLVMWAEVRRRDFMTQELEGLLANG